MKHLKIDVRENETEIIELLEAVRKSSGGLKQAYKAALELLEKHQVKPKAVKKIGILQFNGRVNEDLYALLEAACEKTGRSKRSILLELLYRLNS